MNQEFLKSVAVVQHCQSEHHINGLTDEWTGTPLTEITRIEGKFKLGQNRSEEDQEKMW